MNNTPREYTAEEVRKMFLEYICHMIAYWNSEGNSNVAKNSSSRERLEGLVHSILVMIDGGTGGLPAFDIIPSSHPDAKEFHISQGENWFPDNVVINDCQLHDEYWAMNRKA